MPLLHYRVDIEWAGMTGTIKEDFLGLFPLLEPSLTKALIAYLKERYLLRSMSLRGVSGLAGRCNVHDPKIAKSVQLRFNRASNLLTAISLCYALDLPDRGRRR